MRRLFLTLALLLTPLAARADCVVLLHGLGRTDASMRVLQEVLDYHGYRVVNESYPSSEAPIGDLLAHVGRAAAQCGQERLHFVTHSLGGILVRGWLAQGHPPNLGRVVMLAPPNHGSEIVDTLNSSRLLSDLAARINGPATNQLGTGPGSVPNSLPPVDFDLGVIAGDVILNPLGAAVIEGPNDGTVSVASTRVEGMRDHIVIDASHTLIMMNPVAMAEVLEYLREGAFDHGITLPAALRKLARPRG
jgi:pimeloyl-ACP methyl ester carboxylesterase